MSEIEQRILSNIQNPKLIDKAFKELVDVYQKKIYWYIRKIVLSHDDTHDVLQNTFERVYKNIGSFKANSSLQTWLFTIAYNESIRFINKRKFVTITQSDFQIYSNTLTQDSYFDGEELSRKFHDILMQLTDKQRKVFTMKYFDDLQFNEISKILSVNESTLKSSYYSAVKIIEEKITLV